MLIGAGVLIALAGLLWLIDSWIENGDVDLSLPMRVLTGLAAALMVLNLCISSK
jgi:hypothetical protein